MKQNPAAWFKKLLERDIPLRGSSLANLSRPAERVVAFYKQRGKAEPYIKEGKYAI